MPTVAMAARPGVLSASLLSSFTVRQVSQPQNAKIDPITPATNAVVVRSVNGLNQSQLNADPGRRAAGAGDRGHDEQHQHQHLEADQHGLHPLGGGDPAVGDVGGHRDERQAGEDVDQLVVGQLGDRVGADEPGDEQVEERHRDAGQVGQHDHRGHDQPPAAQPAGVGAECLGGPGERGAAVRDGPVQLAVGVGGQEHRDEAGDEDRRHLQPDRGDDQAERRGQRVGGGHAGHAERDAAQQPDRPAGQALLVDVSGVVFDAHRWTSSGGPHHVVRTDRQSRGRPRLEIKVVTP